MAVQATEAGLTSDQCGCGCRPVGLEAGCPCPECQPGPGISYRLRHRTRIRHARIRVLMGKAQLTEDEAGELDALLVKSAYAD